jgi:hypothetical protein
MMKSMMQEMMKIMEDEEMMKGMMMEKAENNDAMMSICVNL